MKKILAVVMALTLAASLAACGGTGNARINVITREDGSGTRGAFIELFGVEQKDENGEKVDYTRLDAEQTNSTSVMLSTVAGNLNAIGYVSLGALGDTVKALEIDGAAATVENIKNGSYKVSRPFNVATTGDLSEAAADFLSFIMSAEGQAVVEQNGYIGAEAAESYTASGVEGSVLVAGSSSVTPVMEKLKEAYMALNPGVEITVQQSDSTNGLIAAVEGVCDIGMASRELKDSEIAAGLTATVIATDGIAVIVNLQNPVTGLTIEQVRAIYTGELNSWSEIEG